MLALDRKPLKTPYPAAVRIKFISLTRLVLHDVTQYYSKKNFPSARNLCILDFNIESDYRFNFSVFEGIQRLQTEF